VVGLVEPGHVAEPWRPVQGTVQPVDPGVVRALDRTQVPRAPRLKQLVPSVPTRVGEGVERPVRVADQQRPLVTDPDGELIAGLREPIGTPDAHPPPSKRCFVS